MLNALMHKWTIQEISIGRMNLPKHRIELFFLCFLEFSKNSNLQVMLRLFTNKISQIVPIFFFGFFRFSWKMAITHKFR